MKNKKSILIGGLLAALLVIGVIGATNVYAQTPTNTPLHEGGPGGGRGRGLGQPELEAAAKVLGMTTDELSTALQSGKTSSSWLRMLMWTCRMCRMRSRRRMQLKRAPGFNRL